MYENQAKGSYGSYSLAGRNSAARYHLILNKDKILNNQNHTNQYKYPIPSDIIQEQYDYTNEPKKDIFDLNQVPNSKTNKHLKKKKKASSIPRKPNNIQQVHDKSVAMAKNASVIFYTPKLDYVKKRTLTGPKWATLCGRNQGNKVLYNDSDFHITHDMFNSSAKSYVDMKKQTQRGEFASSNDIRFRTERPFSQPKEIRAYHDKTNSISAMEDLGSRDKETNITISHNKTQTYYDQLSSTQRQTVSAARIKRKKYQEALETHHTGDISSPIIIPPLKIKAPNFEKTTSRDYHYHRLRDRSPIAPFLMPDYSAITERPKSIVSMARSIHSNKRGASLRDKDSEPYIDYDILNRAYDKVNNHHVHASPNFGIMTSRPTGHTHLPSYMQKTHNRNSCYITTDKTLAMNHYSDGKLISNPDTFKPKKSFNTYININLLTADQIQLKEHEQLNKKKKKKDESPFTKMMYFYKKNFDNEDRKGNSRFDGITLKTVPKKYELDEYERNKFAVNVYDKDC